jgi:hypothetical protein
MGIGVPILKQVGAIVVAASDTPSRYIATANYVCDGTADNVQIQAAIDLDEGPVYLLPGTYTIAATIEINRDGVVLLGAERESVVLECDGSVVSPVIGDATGATTRNYLEFGRFWLQNTATGTSDSSSVGILMDQWRISHFHDLNISWFHTNLKTTNSCYYNHFDNIMSSLFGLVDDGQINYHFQTLFNANVLTNCTASVYEDTHEGLRFEGQQVGFDTFRVEGDAGIGVYMNSGSNDATFYNPRLEIGSGTEGAVQTGIKRHASGGRFTILGGSFTGGTNWQLFDDSATADYNFFNPQTGIGAVVSGAPISASNLWASNTTVNPLYPGGQSVTYLGVDAANTPGTADQLVCIGHNAGKFDGSGGGADCIAIGYSTGGAGQSGMTGTSNVHVGWLAGEDCIAGSSNVAVGSSALNALQDGSFNVAVGSGALAAINHADADSNVAIGRNAGLVATNINQSVLIGLAAGDALTTGSGNVSIGSGSLSTATTAADNVVIGKFAANAMVTDSKDNVIIGRGAMQNATTNACDDNVVIGRSAGDTLGQGGVCDSNVIIGHDCAATQTNISDELWIENTNGATPLVHGDFSGNTLTINDKLGVGVTPPTHPLHVYEDTAATDNAGVIIEQNGGGDAVIHFKLTGGEEYTIGIDTGDGNKFKISDDDSVGTNDRFIIDNTGNVGIGQAVPTVPFHHCWLRCVFRCNRNWGA